ncbi:hypothetical protein ACERIT_10425 [Halopenitus sp. H-Gu1]|uniref:hypothetical protein n=1 Tax=Halopenitus sp. H-Gu1 TaxID=3242697 RepID=UPI00359D3EC2
MVEKRLTDGVRIAQLLSSEISGDADRLRDLRVTDADPDVEASVDGELAYRIVLDDPDGDERAIAAVHVQPDRARVEFREAPDVAAEAATEAGLRVRPAATQPPRTIVFLEDGAQVKWVLPVLSTVLESVRDSDDP